MSKTKDLQERTRLRLNSDFLSKRLIDNNLLGYWCEAMIAEAVGSHCKITSHGWAAWDLDIDLSDYGGSKLTRIQVKNSAVIQSWHDASAKQSECQFNLSFRRPPEYLTDMECGKPGFLCEVFALCHHFEANPTAADHRDPRQWLVYLLPTDPALGAITESEYSWVREQHMRDGRSHNLIRRPKTMRKGIRGRKPIEPILVSELSIEDFGRTIADPRGGV